MNNWYIYQYEHSVLIKPSFRRSVYNLLTLRSFLCDFSPVIFEKGINISNDL